MQRKSCDCIQKWRLQEINANGNLKKKKKVKLTDKEGESKFIEVPCQLYSKCS